MEVPPKEIPEIFPNLPTAIGRIAITPRNSAPIRVIREMILPMKSEVGLPGRIHGIAPEFLRRLLAISTGLYWMVT